MLKVGSGSSSVGLGDLLLLTAICRQKECVVQLPIGHEKYAALYEGIAEVEFVPHPVETRNEGDDHFSKTKLRALGLDENRYFPSVFVDETSDSFLEKKEELSSLEKPPIIVCANCSKQWAYLRQLPYDRWEKILTELQKKYTPIQFTTSGSEIILPVMQKPNVSIKDLKEYYRIIGQYIGIDTGGHHLIVAVGGKGTILVPPSDPNYEHKRWHYVDYPNIKYIQFNKIGRIPL